MEAHTSDDINFDQLSICVRERIKDGAKIYNYEKRFMLEGERI